MNLHVLFILRIFEWIHLSEAFVHSQILTLESLKWFHQLINVFVYISLYPSLSSYTKNLIMFNYITNQLMKNVGMFIFL